MARLTTSERREWNELLGRLTPEQKRNLAPILRAVAISKILYWENNEWLLPDGPRYNRTVECLGHTGLGRG